MFFCEDCRRERNWPNSIGRSHGTCELCQTRADCYDVPSRYLPIPRMSTRRINRVPPRLPEPECKWGYTSRQIEQIMGDRIDAFYRWMRGQTVSLCGGSEYRHGEGYAPNACGPHGTVVYRCDVEQYLQGGGPLD